jgi:hypothetical protein
MLIRAPQDAQEAWLMTLLSEGVAKFEKRKQK